jgi:hypothetical protein
MAKEIIEIFFWISIGGILGFYLNNIIIMIEESKNDRSKLDEKKIRKKGL